MNTDETPPTTLEASGRFPREAVPTRRGRPCKPAPAPAGASG